MLDHVSFTAEDGKVAGFLGPNGAGKSTTMRAALGLIAPDSGHALIDGRPFAEHRAPLRTVGAVLDAKSAHKGRSAYAHLLSIALTNGIPKRRVDEVMDLTGIDLSYLASKRVQDETGVKQPGFEAIKAKYEAGEWGRKTGKGWYDYTDQK